MLKISHNGNFTCVELIMIWSVFGCSSLQLVAARIFFSLFLQKNDIIFLPGSKLTISYLQLHIMTSVSICLWAEEE